MFSYSFPLLLPIIISKFSLPGAQTKVTGHENIPRVGPVTQRLAHTSVPRGLGCSKTGSRLALETRDRPWEAGHVPSGKVETQAVNSRTRSGGERTLLLVVPGRSTQAIRVSKDRSTEAKETQTQRLEPDPPALHTISKIGHPRPGLVDGTGCSPARHPVGEEGGFRYFCNA